MNCRRYKILSVALLVTSAVSFGYAAFVKLSDSNRTPSKKEKAFDQFCRLTKLSVQSDMIALRSSDPKRRERAYNNILNEQTNHGDLSVRACLGDRMPSSEPWDWCRINEDYECLAKRSETLLKLLEETR